jgi:hypothetical protein
LTLEASLAKKLSFVQYPDDGFLAMFGRDGEFDATRLYEEDRVRDFALQKDILLVPIILGGSADSSFRDQLVRIGLVGRKCSLSFLHGRYPLGRERNTLSHRYWPTNAVMD